MFSEEKFFVENKELYNKLQSYSIHVLRIYGRDIGVSRPTSKRKKELIIDIIKILKGTEIPCGSRKLGAPPKKHDITFAENIKNGIYGSALAEKGESIYLSFEELMVITELLYFKEFILDFYGRIVQNDCYNQLLKKFYSFLYIDLMREFNKNEEKVKINDSNYIINAFIKKIKKIHSQFLFTSKYENFINEIIKSWN